MATNRVDYGGNTLVDLTADTATAADVVAGKTFHLASGVMATGTADYYTKAETNALLDTKTPVVGKGVNLLDNWYFVGGGSQQGGGQFPINQRQGKIVPPTSVNPNSKYYSDANMTTPSGGGTIGDWRVVIGSGTGTNGAWVSYNNAGGTWYAPASVAENGWRGYSGKYAIDRWDISTESSNILILEGDCIHIENNTSSAWNPVMAQRVFDDATPYRGKRFTFSALIKAYTGELITLRYTDGIGGYTVNTTYNNGLLTGSFTIPSNSKILSVHIQGNGRGTCTSADIIAAKLELGDTQTLAHQENGAWVLNDVPDYHEELRKCRDYLFPANIFTNIYSAFGIGKAQTSTKAVILVNVPDCFRFSNNTIIVTGNYSVSKMFSDDATDIEATSFSIASSSNSTKNIAIIVNTSGGLIAGETYAIRVRANSQSKFLISGN